MRLFLTATPHAHAANRSQLHWTPESCVALSDSSGRAGPQFHDGAATNKSCLRCSAPPHRWPARQSSTRVAPAAVTAPAPSLHWHGCAPAKSVCRLICLAATAAAGQPKRCWCSCYDWAAGCCTSARWSGLAGRRFHRRQCPGHAAAPAPRWLPCGRLALSAWAAGICQPGLPAQPGLQQQ